MGNELHEEAVENLARFVDDFIERGAVLFNIVQRTSHKSSYSFNGKYVVVTVQRKVYSSGTSLPSPTRKDVVDDEAYQGGLADGEF